MENIKYIREIMSESPREDWKEVGDTLYLKLGNGNRAKVWVGGGNIYNQSHGIKIEIVNKTDGKVDSAYFPFKNYFKPVRCSKGAPAWYQHLDGGKWYFSNMYTHVLPTSEDFRAIATAVCEYLDMFE